MLLGEAAVRPAPNASCLLSDIGVMDVERWRIEIKEYSNFVENDKETSIKWFRDVNIFIYYMQVNFKKFISVRISLRVGPVVS